MGKKKVRPDIPKDLAARVLVSANRTCCKCRIEGKDVQIHHIDEDPSNNDLDNFAVLCLACHNETLIKGGFGRKLDAVQVRLYRDGWRLIVAFQQNAHLVQTGGQSIGPDYVDQQVEILKATRQYDVLAILYNEIGETALRDKYIELALSRGKTVEDARYYRRMQGKDEVVGDAKASGGEAEREEAPKSPFRILVRATPLRVRSEGLTELVGDLELTCTCAADDPNPRREFSLDITVYLNTQVCSRLSQTAGDALPRSEALLLVGSGHQDSLAVVQGLVTGNSVVFSPVTLKMDPNEIRKLRVTNLRANATIPAPGGTGTPGQIIALVSVNGADVDDPTQIVATVAEGLKFEVRTADNSKRSERCFTVLQSKNLAITKIATLRYSESFEKSFKPHRYPNESEQSCGQTEAVFAAESSEIRLPMGMSDSGMFFTGAADHGTRLKATFNNVPSGVRLFVSAMELPSSAGIEATLVQSKSSLMDVAPRVSIDQLELRELSRTNEPYPGSFVSVWEVSKSSSSSSASARFLDFGLYACFEGNPSINHPAVGTGTVNGGFAPVPPSFTAAAGAVASSKLEIPRFIDTSTAFNVISIGLRRSRLLFPFVTNTSGFDTGISIANVSTDPFGSSPEQGPITLFFYGSNAPDPITTASVAAGTVYTNLASLAAPNFQGYVIAVCNFWPARGYAFVSDLGARNLAMGYLAEILPEEKDDIDR